MDNRPHEHGLAPKAPALWKSEPPSREATERYLCKCGNAEFSLGVSAIYDGDVEDLAGFNKEKRSEAYGSFSAYATCRACERIIPVVNYETA